MKKRKIWSAVAALSVGALTLSACASNDVGGTSNAGGDELTTLRVAITGIAAQGALLTGIEQGFFEDEGLSIETTVVANPAAGLAAAQGGQVDVAYSPSIPLLNALSEGVKLQIVGPLEGLPENAMEAEDQSAMDDTGLVASAKSGITSISDLEGKIISVPARKGQLEVVVAELLEQEGIDPVTGVEWVSLDNTSAVGALHNGTVDAASIVNPFIAEALADGGGY